MYVFDEKYIKSKVKEFNGVIKTNVWSNEIPKYGVYHTCIACITTACYYNGKKELSTSSLQE